jgi:hypothetical protein
MDPWDRLDELLDGIDCAVCLSRVPVARIRLLARRDSLAFVELDCASCGSVALGIVVTPDGSDGDVAVEVARRGELSPTDEARLLRAPVIRTEDVEQMRAFLAGHRGGLHELLGSGDGDGRYSAGRGT